MAKKNDTNYDPNTDFNILEEVKEPGLIPDGTYHGSITSVAYDREKFTINWRVTLLENGGLCTDDETPVDGSTLFFTNWLPKPGDESEMIASGRMTKRQSKINQLGKFITGMKLDETSISAIAKAIEDAEYIGLEVTIKVGTSEYQGVVRNEVKNMIAA